MPRTGPIDIRQMRLVDVQDVMEVATAAFPSFPPERRWVPGMLEAHVKTFPGGQWVALAGDRIVGSATSLRVPLRRALRQHAWKEITGGGYLTTHEPDGDALYGTEIMVHPDARRRGIAKRLYEARKGYIEEHGIHAFVTGGRIPGYHHHANELTASEYVAHVVAGLLEDRTLTPQLRSGLRVAGVLEGYLTDPKSLNFASLLVWRPGWRMRPPAAALDEAARGS